MFIDVTNIKLRHRNRSTSSCCHSEAKAKNLVVNHRRFFNYDKTFSAQRDSFYIGDTVKKDFDLLLISGGSAASASELQVVRVTSRPL